MKKSYFLLLFIFCSCFAAAQTGTIKISKPKEKQPDLPTIDTSNHTAGVATHAAVNYTFKQNNKIGWNAGMMIYPYITKKVIGIGMEYDYEVQYYFSRSQTRTSYLKVPLEFRFPLVLGTAGRGNISKMALSAGIAGKYLLKTKNESGQLTYASFNRFNCNWYAGMELSILKNHYSVGVRYSNDLFQDLKDTNVYNANGMITGKQNSKTHLLSFTVKYLIHL